jgi:hypothetical protein
MVGVSRGGSGSEKKYRDKIVTVTRQEGVEQTATGKARAAAIKYRGDSVKELAKITPKTSESSSRTPRCHVER